jgi:hypothetical protein
VRAIDTHPLSLCRYAERLPQLEVLRVGHRRRHGRQLSVELGAGLHRIGHRDALRPGRGGEQRAELFRGDAPLQLVDVEGVRDVADL